MTTVTVNTYTHSVTYVADNILKSLKDIIRLSGLDPSKLVNSWESNMLALRTWLSTGDLECVVLEIFNPGTGALVLRWDIDIVYGQLKYAIRKAGLAPGGAGYELLLQCKAGYPEVSGWSSGTYRSTGGMVRHSLGTTVEHSGLGGSAAYWRTV